MQGISKRLSRLRTWRGRARGLYGAVIVGSFVCLCAAAPSPNPSSTPLSAPQVLQFLDQTIDWYHGLTVQQQIATTPTDLAIVYDNRQTAIQAVRLAFDFARAEAAFIADDATPQQGQNAVLSQFQSLAQLQLRYDQQVKDTQAELESDRQKLASAGASERQQLQSQISKLQGELDLANAHRDAVHSMLDFVTGSSANGVGASGLRAQIEALARTVPAMTPASSATPGSTQTAAAPGAAGTVAAPVKKPESNGIWNLASDAFSLAEKKSSIDTLLQQTDKLAATVRQLRAPYVDQMKALSSRGDALGKQADTADSSTPQDARAQLDDLAEQFKRLAGAVIPLSKEGVLLELYSRDLSNWKDVVRFELRTDIRSLAVHLGSLLLAVVVLLAAAELWKRAVYRYVADPRRRYQFLLLRRFVLWFLMAVIVAFAFASSAGSIVTFAGLITA